MFNNKNARRNSCTLRSIFCGLAILFLCATACQAIAPAPLPALSLQGLDGSPVSSSNWSLKGKSLLIYVQSDCRSCNALLQSLNKKDYPHLASRVFIIVADVSPAGAKALQQLYPDLSSATWYVDSSNATATALKLQGAPVVFGLKDNVLQWALSGVMSDPAQQKSILNTWCEK